MAKNNQSLWVGVSFLVVGLVVGMLINNGDFSSLTASDDTTETGGSEPTLDPDELQVVSVSADDDAVLGDANAPITIVEFSDFQCPYCEHFYNESLSSLKADYIDTGKVKLVFRDFPLPSHGDASMAAQAAECVRHANGAVSDENYFKMHDLLFENQSAWSGQADAEDVVKSLAKDGLNVDITACLDNEEMKSEVEADYTAGRGYGVSGTPTFFINGKKLVGAWPYAIIEKVIASVL